MLAYRSVFLLIIYFLLDNFELCESSSSIGQAIRISSYMVGRTNLCVCIIKKNVND